MRARLALAALVWCVSGCTPAIGDGCGNSLNCSINGDRFCDTSVRGGECTIFGCESGTCPGEATCVRFRPDPSRLSFTACMRTCQVDGNCRYDDGFRCVGAADVTSPDGAPLAEVVDTTRPEGRFCIATEAPPE
ncbi:MAG: hypothetical protein IT378_15875 [Sandaracinaceae bacterium]|nr:hypothetical protein [Sandaracinaceae bacterium]